MSEFAKLLDSDTYGQILVLNCSGEDDKPVVRVYYQPEGFGVCHLESVWELDRDEDFEAAKQLFDKIDTAAAEKMIGKVLISYD